MMKTRIAGPLALAVVAGGLSSPVLADCCSSFLSCAATVVTEGVSCELQTIIDTIKTLSAEVTNFGNDLFGITSGKEQGARLYVSNTINTMQSQSQQGGADLAAALSQATTIYTEEKTIIEYKATTANTQNLQAASPASVSGPPHTETAQITSEKTPSGAPVSMTAQHSQAITPAPVSENPMLQKSTITAATQISPSAELVAAPHGTYTQEFSRAVTQLTALKGTGDTDLSKVNQYLAQAQSSEGPGVAAADTIAGVMESPVKNIMSQLSAMLAHPLDAFDPSSMVDDMETTLTTAMSTNIPLMISDITAGPNQAFAAAQPTYDDLLANAEAAQQIATAMANLYRLRNTTAAVALDALLPKVEYAGLNSKATTRTVANFGQRQSYAVLAANNAAAKQKLLVVVTPPSLAKIHTLVVQFKAQRAVGKSALPQSSLVSYKNNLSSQLNSYFNGKSPAAVAAERDQLIAQAHTQFATDPATGNSVIAMLNSEAAKRGTTANATAIAPIPGQPVPTIASQNATSFKPQSATVAPAPVNPPVSQTKAPMWGAVPAATATPSWAPAATASGPATTTGMQSSFKATTTLRTAQPIQQQTQQPVMQTAPSSMGR
jgi:hypothetical protein